MAGRGRGRANTLPAWMTKSGAPAPPAAGPGPDSRPPPPPGPPPRNGQFDDAPERSSTGSPSGTPNDKRRSRSRDRIGNGHNGDFRGPPPRQRSPSRPQDDRYDRNNRGFGYGDRRREEDQLRGPPGSGRRSRSRERDRRDYQDYSRRGGDRYEHRGYSRGYRDDYRRNDYRREEEAFDRGYRRPFNGHDDRMTRRYAADYQP